MNKDISNVSNDTISFKLIAVLYRQRIINEEIYRLIKTRYYSKAPPKDARN